MHRIDHADVLTWPGDGKFHAVLCDPPYELTSEPRAGRKKCISGILSDVVLPEYDKLKVKLLDNSELFLPAVSISTLDGIDRAIGIEPGVGVPERSIDLNGDSPIGNPEVKDASVPAPHIPDRELPDELTSKSGKFLGNYVLQFANSGKPAFCNGSCCCFRETGTGLVRMDVTFSFPGSVGLLDVTPVGSQSLRADGVRLCNNAGSKPETSPAVLASRRTEVSAVLTLDVRGRTGELTPADGTGQRFRLTEFAGPENVGTSLGASSLPSEFQPCCIRMVGFATDGAFTLYLHRAIVQRLAHKHNFSGGGFMGKRWDGTGVAFQPETWARIGEHLYAGAFLFAFAGARTHHRIACAIEDAGFVIHPTISYLGWINGAGFPKATRIDTQVDKAAGAEQEVVGKNPNDRDRRANAMSDYGLQGGVGNGMITTPATPLAAAWTGHRYGLQALKPALEPIIVAQKPYAGKPVDSITETGAGALWIDGGRIGTADNLARLNRPGDNGWKNSSGGPNNAALYGVNGRWPANFALSHHPECVRVGEKRVASGTAVRHHGVKGGVIGPPGSKPVGTPDMTYADADGMETVAAWDCHPDCPVRRLDEAVGESKSNGYRSGGDRPYTHEGYQRVNATMFQNKTEWHGPSDTGGPSRFFFNADYALERLEALELPFLYAPKASRSERDAGLEGLPLRIGGTMDGGHVISQGRTSPKTGRVLVHNPHPTIKPIALARWLATLLLPPAEYAPRRLLVPFAGVGSEMIGALLAGWEDVVGVELEAEYIPLAEARLDYWARQPVQLAVELEPR